MWKKKEEQKAHDIGRKARVYSETGWNQNRVLFSG